MLTPLGYRNNDGSNFEMALIRTLQDRQAGAATGFAYAQIFVTDKINELAEAVRREQEEQERQPNK